MGELPVFRRGAEVIGGTDMLLKLAAMWDKPELRVEIQSLPQQSAASSMQFFSYAMSFSTGWCFLKLSYLKRSFQVNWIATSMQPCLKVYSVREWRRESRFLNLTVFSAQQNVVSCTLAGSPLLTLWLLQCSTVRLDWCVGDGLITHTCVL